MPILLKCTIVLLGDGLQAGFLFPGHVDLKVPEAGGWSSVGTACSIEDSVNVDKCC